MIQTPTLLVLGHITRDLFGNETRLGGAASFAARAAASFGIDTGLVTAAPLAAPELEELRGIPQLTLAVAPCDRITTFRLEYSGSGRRLSLLERAAPLTLADVPERWRTARAVYVGPVAGECDAALVESFPDAYVMACIQGWLRDPGARGRVQARELAAVLEPPRNLRAASFSSSDHPRASSIAERLTARGVSVALTLGRQGARVSWKTHSAMVAAEPAAEVDPTGAGDVFALVFGLAMWRGHEPPEAARKAAVAAARVVEGPGLGRLPMAMTEFDLATPRP